MNEYFLNKKSTTLKISKVLKELRPDGIWSISNDNLIDLDNDKFDISKIIWHNDVIPISQEEFNLKMEETNINFKPKELTPEEKLKKMGLTIEDLKKLLDSST